MKILLEGVIELDCVSKKDGRVYDCIRVSLGSEGYTKLLFLNANEKAIAIKQAELQNK